MTYEIGTAACGAPSVQGATLATAAAHQPWLSILVPVYNVQPYVEECLSSILMQLKDTADVELILLDDKSTDGSVDLCLRVVADFGSNVTLLHHAKNRGLSAARNSMLDVARGDYVWFVDSDDKILPGAIKALRAIVKTERPDIILCDYVREREKRYPTFVGPERCVGRCTETLIAGTFATRRLHIWSKIAKRDLFGATLRFPEGACFEDVATVPWLLLKAQTFYYAVEPWIYYRTRPSSIMGGLARKSAPFDIRRNDDLAGALAGFRRDLVNRVPYPAAHTSGVVGRFLSREFVKISKRLVRGLWRPSSWTQVRAEVGRYRTTMEACSPVSFGTIARDYLRRGKIGRALALGLALAAGRG